MIVLVCGAIFWGVLVGATVGDAVVVGAGAAGVGAVGAVGVGAVRAVGVGVVDAAGGGADWMRRFVPQRVHLIVVPAAAWSLVPQEPQVTLTMAVVAAGAVAVAVGVVVMVGVVAAAAVVLDVESVVLIAVRAPRGSLARSPPLLDLSAPPARGVSQVAWHGRDLSQRRGGRSDDYGTCRIDRSGRREHRDDRDRAGVTLPMKKSLANRDARGGQAVVSDAIVFSRAARDQASGCDGSM